MTMRELARLANVSVSTVSKAFHDADDVSAETKKLVFDTAKQHGCYGKFYKGKFHKQIIAIICPELNNSLYTVYVERLQRIIEDNDGIALISADSFSPAVQAELVDYYASYLQVDGLIVFHLRSSLKKGYEIPIVSLFSSCDTTIDTVQVDLDAPIFEAVGLLRSLGHERIAFIGESLTTQRAELFCKAVEESGAVPYRIHSEYRFEKAGEDGARLLLAQAPACTAIICAYDSIAIGAIRYLKRHGYSVPKDFSVIGSDNIRVAEHSETSLTTIDTNLDEVCMIAWDIIQKKQQSKFYRSTQSITISGRLIVRETVGIINPRDGLREL